MAETDPHYPGRPDADSHQKGRMAFGSLSLSDGQRRWTPSASSGAPTARGPCCEPSGGANGVWLSADVAFNVFKGTGGEGIMFRRYLASLTYKGLSCQKYDESLRDALGAD
ncbi:uncharacterized protein N7515_005474 [Penicillium bovifimosum]|uniref:Uncharacterized protein n=1 Tax=Penicillium bovifimosum TaxID=126998 RepID=A0A9W9GSS9_9EURO|nr:uncharacterized protein N7515_005474 [Penicillium bovifimosum]KAJ5129435.1 hypothetical protein N7515_005474 [Penicillium bovifimosum]